MIICYDPFNQWLIKEIFTFSRLSFILHKMVFISLTVHCTDYILFSGWKSRCMGRWTLYWVTLFQSNDYFIWIRWSLINHLVMLGLWIEMYEAQKRKLMSARLKIHWEKDRNCKIVQSWLFLLLLFFLAKLTGILLARELCTQGWLNIRSESGSLVFTCWPISYQEYLTDRSHSLWGVNVLSFRMDSLINHTSKWN